MWRRLLLGIGASVCQTIAAHAEPVVWEGGGWTVALTVGSERRIVGCHAHVTNDAGTRFVVVLYRNSEWRGLLGEHKGQSDFSPGPIQLLIDGRVAHEGNSERLSASGGVRLGTLSPRLIDRLVQGHVLEISTSTISRRPVALSGSGRALTIVEKCVADVFAAEQREQLTSSATYVVRYGLPDVGTGFHAEPKRSAPVLAMLPSGASGLRPLGDCRPSPDLGVTDFWCHFQFGSNKGWAVMRALALSPSNQDKPVASKSIDAPAPKAPNTPSSTPRAEPFENAKTAIEAFAKDKPDFDELSPKIAELVGVIREANPALSFGQVLQIAYDRARQSATSKQPVPAPKRSEPTVLTGTGFFVSRAGHVLTNEHVVEGCSEVVASQPGDKPRRGRVVALDKANDLALVLTGTLPEAIEVPKFRHLVRAGEATATFGFPHAGLLASKGNVTFGHVTATAGLGDDTRMLQTSAPVQSGNSGGPLLDGAGNVLGVVVAKLDAVAVQSRLGDLPQNVNFAIKAAVARTFLEAHRIAVQEAQASKSIANEDLHDKAQAFTVALSCVPGR